MNNPTDMIIIWQIAEDISDDYIFFQLCTRRNNTPNWGKTYKGSKIEQANMKKLIETISEDVDRYNVCLTPVKFNEVYVKRIMT